jgi:Uma2 family endonuclease
MATFVYESDEVTVPEWVTDLASFRHWAESEDFPDTGRICFLNGEVWADMSKEQIFSHVLVKTRIAAVLSQLDEAAGTGLFLGDGAMLSNVDVGFVARPDAIFASAAALQDRVRLIEGRDEGYVELEGSPDMVLEVISPGSVRKDTKVLHRAYWEADVREYWLVDARPEPLRFDVLRHTPKGYRATAKKEGWVKSAVFGRSFRLTRRLNALNHPEYALEAH